MTYAYQDEYRNFNRKAIDVVFQNLAMDYDSMDCYSATYTLKKYDVSNIYYGHYKLSLKHIYRGIYKPIDKFFFGCASTKYAKRVLMIPGFEEGRDNGSPHVHLLIGAPKGRKSKNETLDFLNSLANSGQSKWIREQCDCKFVPTQGDIDYWRSYILKDQYSDSYTLEYYRSPNFSKQ